MSLNKHRILQETRDSLRQALAILDDEDGHALHPQALRSAANQAHQADVNMNRLVGIVEYERSLLVPHQKKVG